MELSYFSNLRMKGVTIIFQLIQRHGCSSSHELVELLSIVMAYTLGLMFPIREPSLSLQWQLGNNPHR